jgi:hypothetical protein
MISRFLTVVKMVVIASTLLMAQQSQSDVLLQGFYWNVNPGDITTNNGVWWDTLAVVADELANAGFKTVWVPPPSKGFAGVYDMGYGINDYYDFGEFNQQGAVRTRHGNKSQLLNMIAALHGKNIEVMVDLVLNHRAGAAAEQAEDCDDGDGKQLRYLDYQPASNRLPADSSHFHPNATHCDLFAPYHSRDFFEDICYFNHLDNVFDAGQPNAGWYFGPHNLGDMGDSLIAWGRYLINDLGFDAVRLDAVKGIEPGFMAPFLVELKNGTQPFAMAEFFDGNNALVKGWHDEVENFVLTYGTGTKNANIAMLDFSLRFALRDMANSTGGGYDMWNLNTAGLKFDPSNALSAEDIVTWIENHDTDRIGYQVIDCSQGGMPVGNTCIELYTDSGHDPVVSDKTMAYAYIMAAEGRPMVFWKDWFWYGLSDEIKWMMALRKATATGSSTPISGLNPFFDSGNGGDLFALRRAGSGSGKDGLVLALNDNPSNEYSVWVDSPFSDMELKDYSDLYMFQTTKAFADGRVLVKSTGRNYAWFAPTGLYPHPPGEATSAFTLGEHTGAKLHYIILEAAKANSFIVNGSPLQPGDQVAILGATGTEAKGIGRIGQSFEWDGVHDMVIEVLGGSNTTEAKGGLIDGDVLRLAVYDKSAGTYFVASSITWTSVNTNCAFSAKRPASRGGSTPFSLIINNDSGTYSTGAISAINSFTANNEDPSLPIQLSSFSAARTDNAIKLQWTTQSEIDNLGFEVYRAEGEKSEFQLIASYQWDDDLKGLGNSATGKTYTFVDRQITANRAYQYRLADVSVNGVRTFHPILKVPVEQTQNDLTPASFKLHANYPNPFNPTTTLEVDVPANRNLSRHIKITIYNSLGEQVKILHNGALTPGQHRLVWDGRSDEGVQMPSGMYIARMQAGAFSQSVKMHLIR